MRWRTYINRWVKRLALFSGLILLVCGLLFGVAQTQWGKAQIASILAWALSAPETKVSLGTIDGLIPFEIRLDRASVADVRGQWLVVEGLTFQWSPMALLKGRIQVVGLGLNAIRLGRIPQRREERKQGLITLPTWPSWLSSIRAERVAVDRILLGKGVFGEEAVFTLEAHQTTEVGPHSEVSTFLEVRRVDGPDARLFLSMTLRGETPILSLHLSGEEAAGGLMASALGYPETMPLAISLHGEGPISYWQGRFLLSAGEHDVLESDIGLRTEPDVILTAKGTLRPDGSVVPPWGLLFLSPESRFSLDMVANDRERISVNLLELEADKAALRGSGLIDFGAQSVEGDFTLRIEDINALQPLVDIRVAGQCVLDGRFLGPLSSPQIELSFSLSQARIAEISAERASGALRITAFDSEVPTFPGFRLSGRGKAEKLALVDRSSIDETSIEWSLDAEIPAGQAIQVRNLQISGENVSLNLSGHVDPVESSFQMDAVLQIDEMRRWLGSQPEISGSVHFKAKIEKEGRGVPIFARIEGRSENFASQSPALSAFLGGEATYEALVRLKDSEALNISGLRVHASGAHLTGEASFGLSDQSLAGKWLMTMPEFDGLSQALGFDVGGSLELAGTVHGHLPDLRAAAALTGRGLSIEDVPVDQLKVNLVAEGQPDDMSGLIQVELQEKDRMVVLTSDFRLEGGGLTLPALAFEGPESVGGGNLDVDLVRNRVEGALHGQFENLYELSSMLGLEIGGGAEIEVQFVPSHDDQLIILSIDADHLSSPLGETRACNLKMRVMNAFRAPQGNVEMQIRDFKSGGLSVASLGIAARGNTQEVNIKAHIKGHYAQDFELETQAAIPGFQRIELNELRGRYGEYLVTLTQPAVVRFLDEGYSLDALAINLGSGTMRASGRFGEEDLTLSVDLRGLPLGAIPSASALGLKASSAGRIQMWGPQDKPDARLEVRLEDLQLSHPFFKGLPQATLGTEAVLRGDTLSAHLVLAGWTERPATAELELPVVISFKPLSITSPPRGELVGRIDVQANLARISRFLHLEDQGLAGLLKVHCSVSGTLDAPVIQARTWIEEGSYENMNTGTILSNVEAELVTRDRRMVIERATANDGAEGVIRMLGWIDIAPEEDFPFEVELVLENAAFLRSDDVKAPASGRLKLSGSLADAILNGNFAVQSTEIHIPDRLSEGSELPEGIEIQPPEAETSQ